MYHSAKEESVEQFEKLFIRKSGAMAAAFSQLLLFIF